MTLAEEAAEAALSRIENIVIDGVPAGGEADFVTLRTHGEPRTFDFAPRDHLEIGEILGAIDMERGTKVSGSRFYFLTGIGARLELGPLSVDRLDEPLEAALDGGVTVVMKTGWMGCAWSSRRSSTPDTFWSSSGPLGDDDPAAYKWLQKSDQPTKPAGGKATPAAEGEDGDGESDGWLLPDLKAAASSSFPIGTRVELHSLNGKPQLNGRVGEVISKPYAKGGRVDVRLDDGSGYNFSTSNLLRR